MERSGNSEKQRSCISVPAEHAFCFYAFKLLFFKRCLMHVRLVRVVAQAEATERGAKAPHIPVPFKPTYNPYITR